MYIVYLLAFRANTRNISLRIATPLSVEDNPEIRYSHKGLSYLHQKLWPCLLSLNLTDFHLELHCTFFFVLKLDVWAWSADCDALDSYSNQTWAWYTRVTCTRGSNKYEPSFSFEAYCFADLRRSTHLFITTLASTSLHEANILDIKHAN